MFDKLKSHPYFKSVELFDNSRHRKQLWEKTHYLQYNFISDTNQEFSVFIPNSNFSIQWFCSFERGFIQSEACTIDNGPQWIIDLMDDFEHLYVENFDLFTYISKYEQKIWKTIRLILIFE